MIAREPLPLLGMRFAENVFSKLYAALDLRQ